MHLMTSTHLDRRQFLRAGAAGIGALSEALGLGLVSRVQAAGQGAPGQAGLAIGGTPLQETNDNYLHFIKFLTVDPARRLAVRGQVPLTLTPKEFAVLEYLLAAEGRIVSAEELLQRVWDESANPFTTTVKTTIGRLRGKLGEPPLIETVREGGYRI